jgi:hypothetical protein
VSKGTGKEEERGRIVINNGIYINSSLTLVNSDLGQIYTSAKHTNPAVMFITIPITISAAFSTGF